MAKVALFTSALLHTPAGTPEVQGFFDRTGGVVTAAISAPGFLDLTVDAINSEPWGAYKIPDYFQKEDYPNRIAQTLSLWRDLDSVFAFTYNGLHAEALSKRKAWFVRGEWTSYVIWWVDDAHKPGWQEACARFDLLHQQGASAQAFDFKHPFDAAGQPAALDRAAIKQLAAHYRKDRRET